MSQGWALQRSYESEHTRLIVYQIAATVPSKQKLPPMQKFWPLLTDDKNIQDEAKTAQEKRAEYIEYVNRIYGKNLTA